MRFKSALSCLVFSLALFSQDFVNFGSNVESYEAYYNEITHDLTRSYDFECVSTNLINMSDGNINRLNSTTTGILNQTISDNGLTIVSNSTTNYFQINGPTTASFHYLTTKTFLDENTMETKSHIQTIRSFNGENTLVNIEQTTIEKMVDGELKVIEIIKDGKKENVKVEKNTIAHDPLQTKYTVITKRTFLDEDSYLKNYTSICNYQQKGIENHYEYIPTVIIGEWKVFKSFNDEAEKNTLKFSRGGFVTYFENEFNQQLGEYNIKKNIIRFNNSKYKMVFNSLNTVVLQSQDNSEFLTLKRIKK